jgi:hypothetical protein
MAMQKPTVAPRTAMEFCAAAQRGCVRIVGDRGVAPECSTDFSLSSDGSRMLEIDCSGPRVCFTGPIDTAALRAVLAHVGRGI